MHSVYDSLLFFTFHSTHGSQMRLFYVHMRANMHILSTLSLCKSICIFLYVYIKIQSNDLSLVLSYLWLWPLSAILQRMTKESCCLVPYKLFINPKHLAHL